jgi:hypothetical protein
MSTQNGSVKNSPSGSGSVRQDYDSADPDPREIFSIRRTATLSSWMTGLREKPLYQPSVSSILRAGIPYSR